MHIALIQ